MPPKRSLSVKLHRAVYPEAAVRAAAKELAGVAEFAIARRGDYTLVRAAARGAALPPDTEEEFLNRVLVHTI